MEANKSSTPGDTIFYQIHYLWLAQFKAIKIEVH